MDRNKILEDLEELEDKSWEQGFIGSNERELFLRESIADYIQVLLKVDSKIIKQPLSQSAVIKNEVAVYKHHKTCCYPRDSGETCLPQKACFE